MRNFFLTKKFLLVAFLCLAFSLMGSSNASAIGTDGITAYPANPNKADSRSSSWFIYNLGPGESKSDGLVVSNTLEEPLAIKIYPVDATTNNVGGFALEKETDSRDGIGKWIELETNLLELAPGEKRIVDFTINIPDDASAGEHAGGIIIQKAPKGEDKKAGFNITTRLGIRVYETVPGDIVENIDFKNASLKYNFSGNSYTLDVYLENNGNVTLEPEVKAVLKNKFSNQYQEFTKSVLIPRCSATRASFEFVKPKYGKYEVELSLSYKSNGELANKNYYKNFSFYVIPWNIIILIILLILANVIFIVINKIIKKRESKFLKKYKAKRGDDLEKIAEKFGMKWKKLAKLNKIKPPYKIKANQILSVIDKAGELKEVVEEKVKATVKKAEKTVKNKIAKKREKDMIEKCIFPLLWVAVLFFAISIILLTFVSWANIRNAQKQALNKSSKIIENIEKDLEIEDQDEAMEPEGQMEAITQEQATSTEEKLENQAPQIVPDISKEEVSVQVLNGYGKSGAAYRAYLQLTDAGFREVSTGSADNFNYTETTISYQNLGLKIFAEEIEDALAEDYENISLELDKDMEEDILIILGI